MRTKSLKDFKKSISTINNHQTQLKFVFEQFRIDNKSNFAITNSESEPSLTEEVFTSNKYSEEFNIQVDEFENETNETQRFLFKSIFVFIYTRFEIYLRNLYFQARHEINLQIPELNKYKIPETFFEKLKIELDDDLSLTFEYLRLRRNSIVHRSEEKYSQGEINRFIKSNGSRLNKFWNSKSTFTDVKSITIKQIDFSKTDIEKFQENEIIDVFNLYRVLSEIIDRDFISKWSRSEWIEIIKLRYQENGSKEIKSDAAKKELSWLVNDYLGTTLIAEEINQI